MNISIDPAGLERAAKCLSENYGFHQYIMDYKTKIAKNIIRAYFKSEPNILIPAYHHYPYDNRKEYVHFLKRKQHGYIGKPLKTLCGGIELTPLEDFVFVNPNDIHPGGRRFHDGSFMDMRWKETAFCQRCYDGWKKNHKDLITSENWEAELQEAKDEWDRMQEARR